MLSSVWARAKLAESSLKSALQPRTISPKSSGSSMDQTKVQRKLDSPNKSPIDQNKVQRKLDSPNKSPMDQNKVQPKLHGPKKSPTKTHWTKEKSNQSSMDQRKVQSKLNGPKKSPIKAQWTAEKSNQNSMDQRKGWKLLKTAHSRRYGGKCFFQESNTFVGLFPDFVFWGQVAGHIFERVASLSFFPTLRSRAFCPKGFPAWVNK